MTRQVAQRGVARPARHEIESPPHAGSAIERRHRLGQSHAAGHDRQKIAARRDAELDVDIGEAEIAVEQQNAGRDGGGGEALRQGDRQEGLSDAAFPGCDGDERGGHERAPAIGAAGSPVSSRRASANGFSGSMVSAM